MVASAGQARCEGEPLSTSVADSGLRRAGRVTGRRLGAFATAVALLALTGCSSETTGQLRRLGLPEAASDRAQPIFDLWIGTWITAGIVGVGVWGLIGWVVVRYRGRSNVMPRQNRYNLPMEIFYTAAPFIVVGVLFFYTVVAQDKVLKTHPEPDHTIRVVGYKWSWIFNYQEAENPEVGSDVWESGTINVTPDLYLPVNKTVRFYLNSPDVIHSFWVPSFYQKMDVIPGRNNFFDVTPTKVGTFAGKCAELCGTYHSAMLFNVKIVSEEDYETYLQTLVAKGNVGENVGPDDLAGGTR